MISINLGGARTVGLVYAIGKADLAWNQGEQNAIEVSVELVGEVRDREAPAAAGLRPRHHHLSAYRRHRAPHPHPRPAGGLRPRRPPLDHHRPAVAGRNDRGAHRHRRHAGAPLRDRRHHRRRQVDGRVAADAQGDRGAAGPARADPRPAQRIRRVAARIQRAGRCQHARPAVLDVPAGRIRRGAVPRPRGGARGGRRAARPDPGGEEPLPQPGRRRLPAPRRRRADRRHAGALPHGRPDQADRRAHGPAGKQERPADPEVAEDAHRVRRQRPALQVHVQLAADRGHDPRDDRQHLPRAA